PLLLITSLTRFFLSISADDRNTHPSGEKGVLFAAAAHRVRPVCGWRKREGDLPVYGEDELTGTEAHASVNKVRVLVDAEYTYMNPALTLVTMALMKKFNKDGAWIWNTYQCYLKAAVAEGFCLGVKLVRGAYMDKERKLSEKEAECKPSHYMYYCDNSYNSCLDVMMDAISQKPERNRIIVATHNEESVRRAAKRMEELGIDKDGGSVCFGQLLGMCDHVSLTLANEGYPVYKSVPYGSVDDTLPYLVRRAQENRTVLQGIRKERDLLRQELRYRIRLGLRGGS
ncbi:Hydroxyproline dehydrogenase, partial [Goodea atripinnis]